MCVGCLLVALYLNLYLVRESWLLVDADLWLNENGRQIIFVFEDAFGIG